MTFLLRYWPHLLAILLAFGAGAWVGSQLGNARANKAELALAHVQRDAAQQLAAEEARARQAEHRHAADMARIGQEHQEALTNAKAQSDRLVSDLRAGNVRLREQWRGCAASLPGTGPRAGGTDAHAGLQAESLGRIDRAVTECEAHVLGLQKITQADRGEKGDGSGPEKAK